MIATQVYPPSAANGNGHQPPSEAQIGVAIAACVVAIAVVLGACALVTEYHPVTYFVMAIAAVALTANFLLTFIPNEIHAGVYLIGVWVLTFVALLLVFRFLA